VHLPPGRQSEHGDQAAFLDLGHVRTVRIPRAFSLAAVTFPTPQSISTGSGSRNSCSRVGRDHEQAVGLGHPAGHLGQELGPGHPDRDRQPTCSRTAGAQLDGDVGG
jgi:hypothetical protein